MRLRVPLPLHVRRAVVVLARTQGPVLAELLAIEVDGEGASVRTVYLVRGYPA